MCEFVSWIEKDGEIGFLTDDIIQPRLEEFKKYNPSWRTDLCGHGAIEWFLPEFKGGTHKEYSGVDIKKYPEEIVNAIKNGKMTQIGINLNLLNKNGRIEYDKIEQPAGEEYDKFEQQALEEYAKIEQPAWEEYAKIRQPAGEEYRKIKQQALEEYKKIHQQALEKYEMIKQPAREEYRKIEQLAFWRVFKNKENRIDGWR